MLIDAALVVIDGFVVIRAADTVDQSGQKEGIFLIFCTPECVIAAVVGDEVHLMVDHVGRVATNDLLLVLVDVVEPGTARGNLRRVGNHCIIPTEGEKHLFVFLLVVVTRFLSLGGIFVDDLAQILIYLRMVLFAEG